MQSLHQGKSAGLSCPPRHPSRSSSARQSHGSTPSFLRLALDCISLFSPVVLGPASWGLSSGPAKSFKSGGCHAHCSRQYDTPRTWRASEAVAVLLLCFCDMVKLARNNREGVRLTAIYQRNVFALSPTGKAQLQAMDPLPNARVALQALEKGPPLSASPTSTAAYRTLAQVSCE